MINRFLKIAIQLVALQRLGVFRSEAFLHFEKRLRLWGAVDMSLERLLGSLSAEQFQGLGRILTPNQMADFANMYLAYGEQSGGSPPDGERAAREAGAAAAEAGATRAARGAPTSPTNGVPADIGHAHPAL